MSESRVSGSRTRSNIRTPNARPSLNMSQPRNNTDFFKRPQSTPKKDGHNRDASKSSIPDIDVAVNQSSSPLSDPLSSSARTFSHSPITGPDLQLKESLLGAIGESASHDTNPQRSGSASASGNSFLEVANTSQRIIKNGKEVVISSDGEDTDSVEELESPEDFFRKLTAPATAPAPAKDTDTQATDTDKMLRPKPTKKHNTIDSIFAPQVPAPKYKFTLESLVTHTMDDDETEAGVAKAKSALESSRKVDKGTFNGSFSHVDGASKEVREDALASALGGQEDDETGLQRLLNAVRRTEAFDREKTWSFFDHQLHPPSPPEFPRDAILPGSKETFLRG